MSSVTIKEGTQTLRVGVVGVSSVGEANTIESVGGTASIAKGKTGTALQVRGLSAGSSLLTITENENDITLDVDAEQISHETLADNGANTHAQIDTALAALSTHIADATIHFTANAIDHTQLTNIGTNTHAQIDAHIANTALHEDATSLRSIPIQVATPADGDILQFSSGSGELEWQQVELPDVAGFVAFHSGASTGYDGDPNLSVLGTLNNADRNAIYVSSRGEVYRKRVQAIAASWVRLDQADRTFAAVMLAVDGSTGTDTPSTTRPAIIQGGDYSLYPFATIQAAIDALPLNRKHICIINVAAGNYAGFALRGGTAQGGASIGSFGIIINGATALATMATGANTGTATGYANRVITMTGAGWTVNDMVGKTIKSTGGTGSGQELVIAANTADTITIASVPSPAWDATTVFEIRDKSTLITSAGTAGCGILIEGFHGSIQINDFKITGCTFGVVAFGGHTYCGLQRITVASGATYGFLAQDISRCAWNQIAAQSCSHTGILLLSAFTPANNNKGWVARSCPVNGIGVNGCLALDLAGVYVASCSADGIDLTRGPGYNISDVTVDTCGTGIRVLQSRVAFTSTVISSSTSRAIHLEEGSTFVAKTSLGGTGNTGWGVRNDEPGCLFVIKGFAPTITGTSGDASMDGTNTQTWASDLNAANTAVHNSTTGSRIVRTA